MLLTHAQLVIHQDLGGLSAKLFPSQWVPARTAVQGYSSQQQDFTELYKVPISPFFQAVKVHLNGTTGALITTPKFELAADLLRVHPAPSSKPLRRIFSVGVSVKQ